MPAQDRGRLDQEQRSGRQPPAEPGQDHAIGSPPERPSSGALEDERLLAEDEEIRDSDRQLGDPDRGWKLDFSRPYRVTALCLPVPAGSPVEGPARQLGSSSRRQEDVMSIAISCGARPDVDCDEPVAHVDLAAPA